MENSVNFCVYRKLLTVSIEVGVKALCLTASLATLIIAGLMEDEICPVGEIGSLVPRPCAFVACSMKFAQRAWARSSCDVCHSLHHGHFTENQ